MLVGDKVKIRAIYKSDMSELQKLYKEPEIIRLFEPRADISLTYMEKKLEALQESKHHRGEWLVIEDSNEKIIGSLTYDSTGRGGFTISSLYIGKEHQNNGYASDAIKRLIKFLFEEKEAKRVEAVVREDCPAALKVFEKLSFTFEGRRRKCAYHNGKYIDEIFMSKLQEEYFS